MPNASTHRTPETLGRVLDNMAADLGFVVQELEDQGYDGHDLDSLADWLRREASKVVEAFAKPWQEEENAYDAAVKAFAWSQGADPALVRTLKMTLSDGTTYHYVVGVNHLEGGRRDA